MMMKGLTNTDRGSIEHKKNCSIKCRKAHQFQVQ